MWQTALAGFLLGLAGSFHCVGMCGPLALALPVGHLGRTRQVVAILLYNAGRVTTYSLMGLLLGWAGRGLSLAGLQQWLSVVMGILVLLLAVGNVSFAKTGLPAWVRALYGRVQFLNARFLQPRSMAAWLLPGLVNGLLPCGMVYLAIAGAVSARQVSYSVGWMFCFGAGTLPAMLALGLFGLRVGLPVRQRFRKAMPWLAAVMAVVLILRGLNLGIPFISPVLEGNIPGAISCHK